MSEIINPTESADEEREKASGRDEKAEKKKQKAASDEKRIQGEMTKVRRETVATCNWNVDIIKKGTGNDARDVTATVMKMLKKRKIIHRLETLKKYTAALAHCINAKPTRAVGHRLYREGPLQLEGMSCLPTTEYDYRILQAAKFFRINVVTLNSMLIELEPRAKKNQPPVLAPAMPIEIGSSCDTDSESTVGIQKRMSKIELSIETDEDGEDGNNTAGMPTIVHFIDDKGAETTDNEEEDEDQWNEPMDVVTTFEGDYADKTKSRAERIRSFVEQVMSHLEDDVDRECVEWTIKCMIDFRAFAEVPSIFYKSKVLQYFKVMLPSLLISDFRPEVKHFATVVPDRTIKFKRHLTILDKEWRDEFPSPDDESEHELLKVHKRITEEREREKLEREKRRADGIYTSDESEESGEDEDEDGEGNGGMETVGGEGGEEEGERRSSSRDESEGSGRGKEDTTTDPSSEEQSARQYEGEEEIEAYESVEEGTIDCDDEGSTCINEEHVEVDGVIVMDDEIVIVEDSDEEEEEGMGGEEEGMGGEEEGMGGERRVEEEEEELVEWTIPDEEAADAPLIQPIPSIPTEGEEEEQEVYAREMEEREDSVEGEGRMLVKLEVKVEPIEANGDEVIFAGTHRMDPIEYNFSDSDESDESEYNGNEEVDVVGVEEDDEIVSVPLPQSPRRVSPLVQAPTPKEPEKKKRKMTEEREKDDEDVVFIPRRSTRGTRKASFPTPILPSAKGKKDDDEIEVIEPVIEVKKEVEEEENRGPRRRTRGLPRQTTPAKNAKREDKKKTTAEEMKELVQGRGFGDSKPSTPDQPIDKRRRGVKTDDEDEVIEVPPPRRTPRLKQIEVKKEMGEEKEDEEEVQYVSTRRGRSKAKTPAKGKQAEEKQKADLSKALLEMGRDLKGSRPSTPDQPITRRRGGETGKKGTEEDKEVEILSPQRGRTRARGKTPSKKVEDKKVEEKKDEDEVQILPDQPRGRGRPSRKESVERKDLAAELGRAFNESRPSTPDEAARSERRTRRDAGRNDDDDVVEVPQPSLPRRASLPRGKSPGGKAKATSPVGARGKRNQAMKDAAEVLAMSKDFNGSKPSTPEPVKRPAVKKETFDEDEDVMVVGSTQKGRGGRQPRGRTPAKKAEEKKPAMTKEEMMLVINKDFNGSKPSTPDQATTKAPRGGTGRKATVKKEPIESLEVETADDDVQFVAVRRSTRLSTGTPMEKGEPKILRGKSPAVQTRKTPAKPIEVKEEEPKRPARGRSTARGKSPHPLSSQPSTSKRGMK